MCQVQARETPSSGIRNGGKKMRGRRLNNLTTLVEEIASRQNSSHCRFTRDGYGGKSAAFAMGPDFGEDFSNLFDLSRIKLSGQKIGSHCQVLFESAFGSGLFEGFTQSLA